MSLSHFKPPFRACPHGRIIDSKETPLCKEIEVIEASEICSILNAHFAKKEEPDPGGICDKCLSIHSPAFIGQKCISSKNCGGTVQEINTPQPNREETDRVAAEYYKSGRTLEVQACLMSGWVDQPNPNFSYSFPWRIKPKKRRVVVEIYQSTSLGSELFARIKDPANVPAMDCNKLLGTIEGEVEG